MVLRIQLISNAALQAKTAQNKWSILCIRFETQRPAHCTNLVLKYKCKGSILHYGLTFDMVVLERFVTIQCSPFSSK